MDRLSLQHPQKNPTPTHDTYVLYNDTRGIFHRVSPPQLPVALSRRRRAVVAASSYPARTIMTRRFSLLLVALPSLTQSFSTTPTLSYRTSSVLLRPIQSPWTATPSVKRKHASTSSLYMSDVTATAAVDPPAESGGTSTTTASIFNLVKGIGKQKCEFVV